MHYRKDRSAKSGVRVKEKKGSEVGRPICVVFSPGRRSISGGKKGVQGNSIDRRCAIRRRLKLRSGKRQKMLKRGKKNDKKI